MKQTPLVSCLCVTRKRIDRLSRSLQCFLAQNYSNKELLIICEDDDDLTLDYVKGLHYPQVRYEVVASFPKKKLGELRNIAIEKSAGEYFCQWDDDDWYHNERLSRQLYTALDNGQPGTILTNWLIYDDMYQQAYLSWTRWWEGSVLYKKEILTKKQLAYPALDKQEDTIFIQSLVNSSRIFPMVSPPIYIYTYHGKNTWDRNRFEEHFIKSQKLSPYISQLVTNILQGSFTNEEASALLFSKQVLEEMDYLHSFKTSAPTIHAQVSRI